MAGVEMNIQAAKKGSALSADTGNTESERQTSRVARSLAIVLALGGCFWGLLLAPWLFRADVSPLAVVVFGPGYLVTLGYIVRSASTPPTGVRLLIWVSSLLVQGAWLLFLTWGVIEKIAAGGSATHDIGNIMTAWWIFATAASAVGLVADWPKQARKGDIVDSQGRNGTFGGKDTGRIP
jgi:hypothetical protein